MVSYAVHYLYSSCVHRIAKDRVEEVLTTLWMWCLAGLPLDLVLWFHQGIERLHRCYLFLADRFLYGHLRTSDIQETFVLD